ncbi:MAG: type I methionyl aminopeptidase [Parcubacteria group bacterium]|nr:type I methionyl aminopeptidase [Parcubacteria group bacterium]
MITIKTPEEIKIMRQGGKILAHVLRELAAEVRVGVSLKYLDGLAEKLILGYGAKPSFKGYKPSGAQKAYPSSLCVSLNHEVVHGVPDSRILKEGDIVGLDLGVWYNGYHTDSAVTLPIGRVSSQTDKLISVTEDVLNLAISIIKPQIYWGDIAYEMQKRVETAGFSVVRELTGHGVGRGLQEDPFFPNYGRKGDEPLLKEGLVIAVEPMVAAGRPEVELGLDGFVYQTKDKSLAAHFEHTVAIGKSGAEILTRL